MVEARVLQVREVFEWIQDCAFKGVTSDALIVRFPEYLPPLLMEEGAEALVRETGLALRRLTRASDHVYVSAYYEDRNDPASCCVVLRLALQRAEMADGLCLDHQWLDEMGVLGQELLARSVALTLQASEVGVNLDLRFPVHGEGAKVIYHANVILLVEDDAFVRNVTHEVLVSSGHRVIDAENAEQALQMFDRNRRSIAMVISDVTMPGKSGRELAELLHRKVSRMPVLLISGYSHPVTEAPSASLFFLRKPYNSAALMTAAGRCLQARHAATTTRWPVAEMLEKAIESC
jgi:CheY-like chemotaxis protein